MDKNVVKIKLNTILNIIMILLILIAVLVALILINKENKVGKTIGQDTDYQVSEDNLSMEFVKLENNEENMIYSPLSIKYALKMLSEGANGNSKAQIDNLVGRLNLSKYENIDKVLSFANGVYIRDTYSKHVKESFRNSLTKKYDTEVNYDAFENANNVNSWIERKTLGIIKNMLKDELVQNPLCKMLLINALAIDMEWEDAFNTNNTQGREFYLNDGTAITATTMNMETKSDSVAYYKDKNITALKMDLEKYEDTQLEFMAIMPKKTNLKDYVKTVTIDKINNITNKLTLASKEKYGVDISIPKFSFDYDLKLKENLKSLGITEAFNDKTADFSNMSDRALYVYDALHKADIEFTEKGVKAAAVTVFVMYDKSAIAEPIRPEEIKIDKPFLFLIRDKETKEIWFVGTVYEPNLWENDKAEYQKY